MRQVEGAEGPDGNLTIPILPRMAIFRNFDRGSGPPGRISGAPLCASHARGRTPLVVMA